MKQRFSLNRLLHNDRLVLILSLVVAVTVWALVSFGPGNITERQITIPVTVDFTGTLAEFRELRVVGNNTFTVTVTVEGPRSVISSLDSNDIAVKADADGVENPGKAKLPLSATKAGNATDYTITAVSPSFVTVDCDKWITKSFDITDPNAVSINIGAISVAQENLVLGNGKVLGSDAIPEGKIVLEGPRSTVSRIEKLEARIGTETAISKTSWFTASLVALDKDGANVDLTSCEFLTPAVGTVDVEVPVEEIRVVDFTYELTNVPAGLKDKPLVTVSPSSITLRGEPEELAELAAGIANLGTIDFHQLLPEDHTQTIELPVPDGISIEDANAVAGQPFTVTLSIAIKGYRDQMLSYPIDTEQDIVIKNLPAGKTLTLQSKKLSNIVLCGDARDLRNITAEDLVVVLDAAGSTGTGSVRYGVTITVPSYPSVWVYYGDDGYYVYGTLT